MNDEYTLINTLYGRIEEALSNKSNVNTLMRYIQRYADRNSDILLSCDLSERLIFSESDKKIMYTVTGITQNDVSAAIKKTDAIKSYWKTANNPFYVLTVLVMCYFARNSMTEQLNAVTVYMSYLIYTSSHKSFFKFKPNKQIMDYTINNLSNRYLIKQVGTLQAALEHTVVSAINGRFEEDIRDGSDVHIKDILSALETRISSFVKYIANEFYKNHKSGNYMFHEDEDLSEENFHLSDNISFKIDRIVSLVSSSIISEGFDQYNCIKRAISLNPGASSKKLESMLNTIVEEDMESIPKFVSDILTLFIYKGQNTSIEEVRTMKFISESMQIYKSNSQDAITLRIKEKLLHWIDITSEKFGRNFISRGKTSLDTYRRCIYTCFIFKILECVK